MGLADAGFEDPRLADLYDLFEGERSDLDPYLAMADAFGADQVVDLGCGTGTLACRLAGQGKDVVGVDPSCAMLAVARRKEHADRVRWLKGTATTLPPHQADLLFMTGNVAQVFLTDTEWLATLRACRAAVRPGGRIVFETRDPAKESWRDWTREQTEQRIQVPGTGIVDNWIELGEVRLPRVSFRDTVVFQAEGLTLTSASTLRFRTAAELTRAVERAGLCVEDIRDAPDRPSREFVFITQRPV